jgi:hypothetical protein
MDRNAFNYDTSAQVDDGSCIAKFRGCMDPNAANYNRYFNVNDPSSCIQNADVDGDDCAPDPCGEHGSCHDLFKAWRCVCNSGWSGRQCDSPPGSAPPPPAGQCPDGTYSGSNGKCRQKPGERDKFKSWMNVDPVKNNPLIPEYKRPLPPAQDEIPLL